MTTTQAWRRSTRVMALGVLGMLLLGRAAAAQVDVDSLPGDQKGAKIPFQRSAGVLAVGPSCEVTVTFNLPYADVTIETVTAWLTVDSGIRVEAALETVVGGVAVAHTILLTPSIPYRFHEEDASPSLDYQGTQYVRIHHLNKPDQPLKMFVSGAGVSCSRVFGGVTVAGYYKELDPRH
jgi:hypothetical protein